MSSVSAFLQTKRAIPVIEGIVFLVGILIAADSRRCAPEAEGLAKVVGIFLLIFALIIAGLIATVVSWRSTGRYLAISTLLAGPVLYLGILAGFLLFGGECI